jgi:N-acetyltransferase
MKRQRVDSLDFNPISPSIALDFSSEVCQDQVHPDHENLSPKITSPSLEHLQENLSASLVPKVRVSPAESSRSIRPLGVVKSADQNQRVQSVGGEDQAECSTGKLSSKIKGIKAISGGRVTKSIPRSKLAPHSRQNTTIDPSENGPDSSSITGRAPASDTTSLSSDVQKENLLTAATGSSDDHPSGYSPEVMPAVAKRFLKAKPIKKSSIRNYFQALPPPSSSPSTSRSVIFSDEVPQRTPSPPSSPPSLSNARPSIYSRLQKVRRRLSTKPQLPSIYKREASTDTNDSLDHNEIAGDFNDPPRNSVMEHSLDREDSRMLTSKHAEQNQDMGRSNAPNMMVASESQGSDLSSSHPDNDYVHIDRSDVSQHDPTKPHGYRFTRYQYPSSPNPDSNLTEKHSLNITPMNIPGVEERKLKPKPPPSKGLIQQLLDLGQTPHTECKECGMHFTMAIPSERRTHDAYHKLFSKGCLKKMNLASILVSEKVDVDTSHKIFMVDYKSALKFRDLAESILENTLADMDGAVPSSQQLWSTVRDKDDGTKCEPRFKFFFYTVAETPVGILLAERVGSAQPYVGTEGGLMEGDRGAEGASTSGEEMEVYMAVDRIWVHRDWRLKGIARHLVDVAREKFIGGMVVERDRVAVSHPTTAGRAFAGKYFEGVFGEVAEFLVC